LNPREILRLLPAPVRPALVGPYGALRELYYRVRNATATPHASPVFILGNQKSGTSAVASLLGMMTGKSTAIDLRREYRNKGPQVYPRITSGELPFEELIRRNPFDFSREIVKEPNLTFFYEELVRRFPASRFAIVVRDPRDNLRSFLNAAGIEGDLSSLPPERLAETDPGFALLFDGRWCGIEADPHYMDQLGARWNACADAWLERREAMVLVRYEDFLADKLAVLRRLAGALELEPRHDVSAQLDVSFQPPGDPSVLWHDFFGANLERIERICADRMRELGYVAVGS
jgi:hypothetical protein